MRLLHCVIFCLFGLTLEVCIKDDQQFTKLNEWLTSIEQKKAGNNGVLWYNHWKQNPQLMRGNAENYLHIYATSIEDENEKLEFYDKVQIFDALSAHKNIPHYTKCYYNQKQGVITKVLEKTDSILTVADLENLNNFEKLNFYITFGYLLLELEYVGGFYDFLSLCEVILLNGDIKNPIIAAYDCVRRKGPTFYQKDSNYNILHAFKNFLEVCEEISNGSKIKNPDMQKIHLELKKLVNTKLLEKAEFKQVLVELHNIMIKLHSLTHVSLKSKPSLNHLSKKGSLPYSLINTQKFSNILSPVSEKPSEKSLLPFEKDDIISPKLATNSVLKERASSSKSSNENLSELSSNSSSGRSSSEKILLSPLQKTSTQFSPFYILPSLTSSSSSLDTIMSPKSSGKGSRKQSQSSHTENLRTPTFISSSIDKKSSSFKQVPLYSSSESTVHSNVVSPAVSIKSNTVRKSDTPFSNPPSRKTSNASDSETCDLVKDNLAYSSQYSPQFYNSASDLKKLSKSNSIASFNEKPSSSQSSSMISVFFSSKPSSGNTSPTKDFVLFPPNPDFVQSPATKNEETFSQKSVRTSSTNENKLLERRGRTISPISLISLSSSAPASTFVISPSSSSSYNSRSSKNRRRQSLDNREVEPGLSRSKSNESLVSNSLTLKNSLSSSSSTILVDPSLPPSKSESLNYLASPKFSRSSSTISVAPSSRTTSLPQLHMPVLSRKSSASRSEEGGDSSNSLLENFSSLFEHDQLSSASSTDCLEPNSGHSSRKSSIKQNFVTPSSRNNSRKSSIHSNSENRIVKNNSQDFDLDTNQRDLHISSVSDDMPKVQYKHHRDANKMLRIVRIPSVKTKIYKSFSTLF